MERQFTASMKVSGRTFGLLGRQSISTDEAAIFELVKNAKDADATHVEISFVNAEKKEGGSIIVRDDGHGMTKDVIDNVWMVVGTDNRHRNRKSKGGRQALGEMGIGRLSCDRLAERTIMRSYPQEDIDMVVMEFDWTKYDKQGITLGDVSHKGHVGPKDDPKRHGLELVLEGLRSKWDSSRIQSLSQDLQSYILPSGIREEGDFEIKIMSNGSMYKGENVIKSTFLKKAPLRLVATYNGNSIDVKIIDSMGDAIKTPDRSSIDVGPKQCGPFVFRLSFYPQDSSGETHWKDYYKRVLKVISIKKFLRKYAGVYLYRDGAWVKPYGAKHDWLNLEGRRVQRRSNIGLSQVFGKVDISNDTNPKIQSTAHREVLQENEAFHDLKDTIKRSIQELEKYRESQPREAGTKPTSKTHATMAINNANHILKIAKEDDGISSASRAEIIASVNSIKSQVPAAVRIQEDEEGEGERVRQHELNILSIGLLASYVSREIASSLKRTISVLSDARQMMETTDFKKPLPQEVIDRGFGWLASLEADSNKIMHFATYVNEVSHYLAEARRNNRFDTQIDIAEVWEGVIESISLKSELPRAKITLYTDPHRLKIRFNETDLKSILSHLVTNSTESIKRADSPRQIIQLDVKHDGKNLVMKVSDTGEGIVIERDTMFDPFTTTRQSGDDVVSGQGFGLPITREILRQYEGSIDVEPTGDLGTGATFTVKIPAKYARKVY